MKEKQNGQSLFKAPGYRSDPKERVGDDSSLHHEDITMAPERIGSSGENSANSVLLGDDYANRKATFAAGRRVHSKATPNLARRAIPPKKKKLPSPKAGV